MTVGPSCQAGLADPDDEEETARRVLGAMWQPRYPRLARAAEPE